MKLLKFFTLSIAFSLSSLASAEFGGISGGGGGTTTPRGVDVYQVTQAVSKSKILLRSWLNDSEHFYLTVWLPKPPRDHDRLLFDGHPNVFDLISNLKIEIKTSGPCYTSDGREVDGSIYPETDADICISVKNLSEKLNENNYEFETVALIMHEIMHLLGATEEQAENFQRWTIYNLKNRPIHEEQIRLEVRVLNDLKYLMQNVQIATEFIGRTNQLCSQYQNLREEYGNFALQLPSANNDLHALRALFQDGTRSYATLLRATTNKLCSQDPTVDERDRSEHSDQYERCFGGQSQVTSDECLWREFKDKEKSLMNIILDKIETPDDAKRELQKLKSFLIEVHQMIQSTADEGFELIRN